MRKKIEIGKTKLKALPFVLGGNVFGWTADEKTSFQILDQYLDEGFGMIDTADCYAYWAEGNRGGESERVLGKWLKKSGKRQQVILATKVGNDYLQQENRLSSSYIRQQVELSLRQLQTDYIDIYYTHKDDLTTPIEETLRTYTQLVEEGKVRHIAWSNMSAARIRESAELSQKLALAHYVVAQPEYNMSKRAQYEQEYEALVQEMGQAVFPYYSLANGFLTGKYKSVAEAKAANSARSALMGEYLDQRGQRILKELAAVAEEFSATSAQVALAWLLARPSITAPIASVSKPSQLDILKCVDLKLDKELIERLNEASSY